MSEHEHIKGKLTKVTMPGVSKIDRIKHILEKNNVTVEEDITEKDLLEVFDDELYEKYIRISDEIYKIETKEIDPYNDFFEARMNDEGEILFDVMYYNGACGLYEAIEEAVKNMQ